MSAVSEPRRRADAERSRAAILDAALALLPDQPGAGMSAIAAAAGVSRQTIYAHFPSRDDLRVAVADRLAATTAAAMSDADLTAGSPTAALLRVLDISWRAFEANTPVMRNLGPVAPKDGYARHIPVTDHLLPLLRRGLDSGEFTCATTPEWLATAIVSVGAAAKQEVKTGRMTRPEAEAALRESVLRLAGAPAPGT
ncbi:TetR/AcrR family transcriptional regulator [Nocardia sp. NPDC005978]|uniref:TetR/AcrR family transcriptional regulator n=1 Tax=Nocardia sp. NPDC005978 TaxID=3156725 RepID=UPI0033B40C9C